MDLLEGKRRGKKREGMVKGKQKRDFALPPCTTDSHGDPDSPV